MELSKKNLTAFTAVVDTLLPAVGGKGPAWTTPGSDLGLDARLPALFERLPHPHNQEDLKRFLGLLDSTFGGILLFGKPWPFGALTSERRAEAFRRIEGHPVGRIRRAARAVKTLVGYLWVTSDDAATRPASWEAIGYPGPDGPPPLAATALPITTFNSDTTMTCDVVVVGSGAGGSTAAGVLAGSGPQCGRAGSGGLSQ